MWRRVDIVYTGVSEEYIACSHLLTLVPRSQIFSSSLKLEAIRSSETPIYTISTLRHILKDGIPHSHHRENLKFYIINSIIY
jgi:hypothetical protein